jgi:hypothetical protein
MRRAQRVPFERSKVMTEIDRFCGALAAIENLNDDAVCYTDPRYIDAWQEFRESFKALLRSRFPGVDFYLFESASSIYAEAEINDEHVTVRASDRSRTSRLHINTHANLCSTDKACIEFELEELAEKIDALRSGLESKKGHNHGTSRKE